jgi:hypothetical protein
LLDAVEEVGDADDIALTPVQVPMMPDFPLPVLRLPHLHSRKQFGGNAEPAEILIVTPALTEQDTGLRGHLSARDGFTARVGNGTADWRKRWKPVYTS